MKQITIGWLAFMVSAGLVSRGVDTTAEAEEADIREWLAERDAQVAADAWDEGAEHGASNGCRWRATDGERCPENPYRVEGEGKNNG